MKIIMFAVVAMMSLSGCVKLWEDERTECIPLPETEIPVSPDPWEPGDADNETAGK